MAYGLEAAEMVPLDRVFLDIENPRHKPQENQPEAIRVLCDTEQVDTLAADIAEHGLNPLELFALISSDGGKTYVAIEGNRRLCALMLLNDPQRAPTHLRKRFETASKKWMQISEIFAVVFPSLEDVRIWRDRIHGGPDSGRGRREWDSEQKARNTPNKKNNYPQAVLDYAQQEGLITDDERKGRLATVQKYLGNPELRSAIGLSGLNPEELKTDLPAKDFAKMFSRFIRDVAERKIDTRTGRIAKFVKRYADEITAETKTSGKRIEPTLLKPGVIPATSKPKKQKAKKAKKVVKKYIASDTALEDALFKLKSFKLQKIYYSITNIALNDHTPMLTVAAWSFIESLTRANGSQTDFLGYLSKQKLTALGVPKKEQQSRHQALKRISDTGNTTKHDSRSAAFNGEQLANDFEVLTPILTKLALEAK